MTFITRRILIATVVVALVAAAEAQAGLIAHWTLDNNTTGLTNLGSDGATSDLAIPAASASISGGPTFTASGGPMGGYATFDGNQALIANTAGNAADDLPDYPFTLAAWYRPAPHPTTPTLRGAAIGISNSAAASTYYTIGVEANNSAIETSDAQAVRRNTGFTSTEGVGTSSTVNNGNWHHIAVVNASAASSVLYLNGAQVGTSATSVTFAAAVNTIVIGAFLRNNTAYTDKFYGDIDDPRIYDHALTPLEISDLVPEPASLMLALCAGGFALVLRARCNVQRQDVS